MAVVDLLIVIVGYSIALWAVGSGQWALGKGREYSRRRRRSRPNLWIVDSSVSPGREKKRGGNGWAAHYWSRLVTQTDIFQSRLRRCRRPQRERPSSSFEISNSQVGWARSLKMRITGSRVKKGNKNSLFFRSRGSPRSKHMPLFSAVVISKFPDKSTLRTAGLSLGFSCGGRHVDPAAALCARGNLDLPVFASPLALASRSSLPLLLHLVRSIKSIKVKP
ncbi:hypothetical protein VTN02DRAFT_5317 [Thermoascus thermophilus]